MKFFLHLSKDEQRGVLSLGLIGKRRTGSSRRETSASGSIGKNTKTAYEDAINATATPECPWYVIPADDKHNMRLMVAQVILSHLRELKMEYPELDKDAKSVSPDTVRTW